MTKLRVVVTGAGGFLHSRLIRYLGHQYTMLPISRADLDICNEQKVHEVICRLKPDIIVHGAAMTSTALCEKLPETAYKVNVAGACNLARAAKLAKAKMLFWSSEQVFNGNAEPGPYSEEHKPKPNTVYGQTKLAAEEELKDILSQLWIVRLGWLFGLPERNTPAGVNLLRHLFTASIHGVRHKTPVHEFRGITYVYDVLDYFGKLINLPFGTYHLAADNQLSTYETAVAMAAILGADPDRLIEPDREKYHDKARDLRLDSGKIIAAGIPVSTTKDGIERALREYGIGQV